MSIHRCLKIHVLYTQTFADIWIQLYSSDVDNGHFQQAIEIEPYQLPKQRISQNLAIEKSESLCTYGLFR